jgi:hypothetical protein
MKSYYVNKRAQTNGDHEVHEEGCRYMPGAADKSYLGEFSSCKGAVDKAKQTYSTADGCKTCSPDCQYI